MAELSCREWVELVTVYLDGALDDETQDKFLNHLAMCDGCRPYLDQFRQTIRTVGVLRNGTLPHDLRDALLTAFRTPPTRVQPELRDARSSGPADGSVEAATGERSAS
jgi:predicted anti-sigma-YlaC factor YlaD